MAASRADQAILSSDPTFKNRVRQSMVAACISISNEGWAGGGIHRQRIDFATKVLGVPDSYKQLFAISVATDASVIADATVGGTVVLTAANVAAQGALVTDAHMDNAVSGQFNSFFLPPL
jgi:hypothetical protein